MFQVSFRVVSIRFSALQRDVSGGILVTRFFEEVSEAFGGISKGPRMFQMGF